MFEKCFSVIMSETHWCEFKFKGLYRVGFTSPCPVGHPSPYQGEGKILAQSAECETQWCEFKVKRFMPRWFYLTLPCRASLSAISERERF